MPAQEFAVDIEAREPASGPAPGERPIPALTRARIAVVRGFLMGMAHAIGLSGLYRFGQFFGTLEYLSDYKRRRRVHAKLIELFKDEHPASWRRRVVRHYFMRVRCDKMFYTIMDRIPRGKLMNRIKLIHRERLDAALARGKGVYAPLCHFGSHHVAGLMMALLGYSIAGVRDAKESRARRYIQQKYRETFPEVAAMKLFFANSFPRGVYRQLQSNGIVASLLDVGRSRGDTMRTMPVRIFGEQREYLVGPVQMAVRCGATIIPGFVISRQNFYYRVIVGKPLIEPEQASEEPSVLAELMQHYADGVEAFARGYPDHLMNI